MKPNWIKNKAFPGEKFHRQTTEQGKPQTSGPSLLHFCPLLFPAHTPEPCEPLPDALTGEAQQGTCDGTESSPPFWGDAVPHSPAAPGRDSVRFEVSGKFSIYFSRDGILPEVTADVQRDAPRPCRSPWLRLLPFTFPSASLPSAAARVSLVLTALKERFMGGPLRALEP